MYKIKQKYIRPQFGFGQAIKKNMAPQSQTSKTSKKEGKIEEQE